MNNDDESLKLVSCNVSNIQESQLLSAAKYLFAFVKYLLIFVLYFLICFIIKEIQLLSAAKYLFAALAQSQKRRW